MLLRESGNVMNGNKTCCKSIMLILKFECLLVFVTKILTASFFHDAFKNHLYANTVKPVLNGHPWSMTN